MKILENTHTENGKLKIKDVTKMYNCFTLRRYKIEEPKNNDVSTLISLEI